MKIFEYDVMNDLSNKGRTIPVTRSVRFWFDPNSYIEVKVGTDGGLPHILLRAGGHQLQLQIEPVVSNTIHVGLK